MTKRRTRGVKKFARGHHQAKGVERPRLRNARSLKRRHERLGYDPTTMRVRRDPKRKAPTSTGTAKQELIAQARRETGRANMRWKATVKYMKRLDRRAKAGTLS